MIHIIGTCHKTQILTDLVRKRALGAAPESKLKAFENYLADAARGLGAVAIAEEMSEGRIRDYGHNAVSIARMVARKLNSIHIFCEPDVDARRELGLRAGQDMVDFVDEIVRRNDRDFLEVHQEEVRKQFTTRERFWISCIKPHLRKGPLIFVCGADHCETFPITLSEHGIDAQIYNLDWTLTAEIQCPCCM